MLSAGLGTVDELSVSTQLRLSSEKKKSVYFKQRSRSFVVEMLSMPTIRGSIDQYSMKKEKLSDNEINAFESLGISPLLKIRNNSFSTSSSSNIMCNADIHPSLKILAFEKQIMQMDKELKESRMNLFRAAEYGQHLLEENAQFYENLNELQIKYDSQSQEMMHILSKNDSLVAQLHTYMTEMDEYRKENSHFKCLIIEQKEKMMENEQRLQCANETMRFMQNSNEKLKVHLQEMENECLNIKNMNMDLKDQCKQLQIQTLQTEQQRTMIEYELNEICIKIKKEEETAAVVDEEKITAPAMNSLQNMNMDDISLYLNNVSLHTSVVDGVLDIVKVDREQSPIFASFDDMENSFLENQTNEQRKVKIVDNFLDLYANENKWLLLMKECKSNDKELHIQFMFDSHSMIKVSITFFSSFVSFLENVMNIESIHKSNDHSFIHWFNCCWCCSTSAIDSSAITERVNFGTRLNSIAFHMRNNRLSSNNDLYELFYQLLNGIHNYFTADILQLRSFASTPNDIQLQTKYHQRDKHVRYCQTVLLNENSDSMSGTVSNSNEPIIIHHSIIEEETYSSSSSAGRRNTGDRTFQVVSDESESDHNELLPIPPFQF